MIDCQYSRWTGRRWAHNDSTRCVVVECRAPQAKKDAANQRWFYFKGRDGVRFAVDDAFEIIPGAGYLEVRSRVCNKDCPYYSISPNMKNYIEEN